MGKGSTSRKKETEKKRDEVEELIQAAQDQLLLKLSVDSHMVSASASASDSSNKYLDLDLERRFEALKSCRSSEAIPSEDQEVKTVIGDDLSARFAALKGKSNSSSSSTSISAKQVLLDPTVSNADDENEDDEVERLIQWAKDAARLDPSPPSDDDEEKEEQNDEDDENSSGEENQNRRKRN